jgi:hypothetical protein
VLDTCVAACDATRADRNEVKRDERSPDQSRPFSRRSYQCMALTGNDYTPSIKNTLERA